MVEGLQLVFIIRDKNIGGKLGIAYTLKYIKTMVKLLWWYQKMSVKLVYSMVEVIL